LNKAAAGSWGNYHALIIGVNQYKQWPRLQTAVKDATVIRNTLVELYGFAPKNVILRTDNAANRLQITRDLRYLAQSMRPDDNLLIYYAGHGQLDDLTGDGYWVPVEGALKDPATWVANSYIKAILSSEKVQAKNVVVIADSCYSGSMLRGGPSLMSLDDQRYREKLAEKAALRSRQVISSGGVEPVADGGAEGHSLFAFYLIDALRKNDREVIDLENLFHTKVWKPVTEIGDQRPNVGRLKTPMDQDGQFVLYNTAWIREQQARRAALAAEQQKQAAKEAQARKARQQAAVASAELELQRQRIEMEKQKLAIEKEQIARERALEKQQRELEKQKQEIEYAKLQARLKELEIQGEANTRMPSPEKLQASLDKKLVNSRSALRMSYNLAIFPAKILAAEYGHAYIDTHQISSIEGISAIARDDDRLALKYSYKLTAQATEVMLLEKALGGKPVNIWKKKSMFSKAEPDLPEIRKLAREINADAAIMMIGQVQPGDFIFYLYDVRNDKLYAERKKPYMYSFAGEVKTAYQSLLNEFIRAQSGGS